MEKSVAGAMPPKIQLLRKTSSGLAGTYKNLEHHARPLRGIVDFLSGEIPTLGFDVWLQGHNVHILQSRDARRFVLRPIAIKGRGYTGISLDLRVSRTTEVPLAQIFADRPGSWDDFIRMLRFLAQNPPPQEPMPISDQEQ